MGCSIFCSAFEQFSAFLEWALGDKSGLKTVVHYLDGFLFAGPAGSGNCGNLLRAFMSLTRELGVPLAEDKTEGPAKQLTFLGIELDTEALTSRLPLEKLYDLREVLLSFMRKMKVLLHELQALVGHLNFSCKVVAFYFRVKRMLEGWHKKEGPRNDSQQPLSPRILKGLYQVWCAVCTSDYERLLFHAASLLAFFGALRISKLVASSRTDRSGRVLDRDNVSISGGCVQVLIRSSKTNQLGKRRSITLESCGEVDLCPVRTLSQFLAARKVRCVCSVLSC